MPDDAQPVTDESLVAQLIARLDERQRGAHASTANLWALRHAQACQEWLATRTERSRQGPVRA